jgi:hypothetical protein
MKMPNAACTSRYLAAAISTQPKCHVAAVTVVASTAGESSSIRVGTNASSTRPIKPSAISVASIELRPSRDQ